MAAPSIRNKRSSVSGKVPTTTDLSFGEIGLNTYDGKVFISASNAVVGVGTTIITVNPWSVGIGSTAYNTYFNAGNVGVGTTNPQQKLHVLGNVLVAAGSSTDQYITQKPYELNNGTLSWEGSAGQLFSITNNLSTGSIFSVNDISGIPSIDVDAGGAISLGAYGGNIGVGTTNPTSKLHVVGNVLVSGIVTATTFVGNLTGTATTAMTSGYATTAGIATYSTSSGIATYATTAGVSTYATTAGIATYATSSGIATYATTAGIATYATSSGIATYATSSGIATYATTSGISTYATSSGIATYATTSGISTYATTAGIATNVIGGIGSITQLQVTGISTFTNGPVFIGSATSTGTASQPLQVTGGAYVSGNLGIGTTNPTSKLSVVGNVLVSGIVTATTFVGNLTGTATTAGIATYATTAGIATYATSAGIATYATSSGIATYATSSGIATYATTAGIATYATIAGYSTSSGISTYATSSGIATYATTAGIATNVIGGIGSITQLQVTGISTFTNGPVFIGAATSTGTVGQVLQVAGISSSVYIGGVLGIGTTLPGSKLTVVGDVSISGVTTASRFVSLVAQGTAPISVASSTLVTNLNANYLNGQPDTYYTNASNLSSGTVPSARITAASGNFTVGTNLYVNGTLSVAGTSIILNAQQLQIGDRDIVLGFTTDANNNEISTDNTANHGGIAIASTVGSPIINIPLQAGINSNPSTYKQFMWIKQGNYSGLGTDVWLSNYAISIGNTATVQNLSRLTVGAGFTVFDTYLDAQDIRSKNINSSGIITATTFVGNLTGTATTAGIATYATSSGIATYATTAGIATYATTSGIATYATNTGIATYATSSGIATYATTSGIATYATSAGISTYATTAGIATNVIGGIGSITQIQVTGISTFTNGPVFIGAATSTGTVGQVLQVAGINSSVYIGGNIGVGTTNPTSKLHVVGNVLVSGIVTATTFVGNLTGTATTAGIATYATSAGIATYATSSGIATYATTSGIATYATSSGISTYATSSGISTYATSSGIATYATTAGIATYATSAGIATYATTSGVSTSVIGGIGSVTQLQVTGISTFTNGPVLIGAATSTGTASQRLQVTGGAYVSGNLGIGTTNPTSTLQVQGTVSVSSTTTSAEFVGGGSDLRNLSGTHLVSYASAADISNSALSISGISTYNRVGILTGSLAVDANDNFGYSVATSADGKTIIVGAYSDEIGATLSTGVVYVYDRVGSSFNQVGILTGSLAVDANDSFGISVATSADGKTIIVGAYGDEIGATLSTGVVYVYDRVGSSFNQVGILTGSLAVDANDSFGISVATSADGKTIIVGAYGDEIGATLSTGVVYVYDRVGSSFNQVGILTGSLAVNNDFFGISVATSADGKTIVVGAGNDEIGATAGTGVVYVYDCVGSSFNQVGILTGSLAVDANDSFGYSVATSADGKTIIVGASGDEIGATTDTGVAYIFKRQGNSFNQVGILTGSLAVDANDNFGTLVATSADGKTIIVGAISDEIGATLSTGVVYVFDEVRDTYVYSGPTGNIGVGTTNPTSKLHVVGNVLVSGVTTSTVLTSQTLSVSGISTFTNGPVLIGTATSTGTASQRLQVTGGAYISSNVGIAVTSPSFAADVSGDARVQSTGKMRFGGTAGTTNFYIQYNSTTNSLDFVAG